MPVIPLPTSPFIVSPFIDPMVIPEALAPGWRLPDGTLAPDDPLAWSVRETNYPGATPTGDPNYPYISPPGPGVNQQDSIGFVPALPGVYEQHDGQHQVWPNEAGKNSDRLVGPEGGPYPDPILYHIRVQPAEHSFTSSPVQPITALGTPVAPENLPPGVVLDANGTTTLPMSTIYSFNGTFPGPMINAEYGKPVLVRFENDLDQNPLNLDRQDFGDPEWKFLTHLHNGHTAPESDGNPFYMQQNGGGYLPGQWSDNLYLNYPAGGDPSEKQSFFWFHDHTMHHTGENVYKGLVGLFPIYDPKLDPGDERDPGVDGNALHLPGLKTVHENGTFDVKYDIPMAFYDTMLDDGTTTHHQLHGAHPVDYPFPDHITHPEWWGKSFYAHDPDLGFVGDIFTVNGTAFPVLHVTQRQYRFRFLDASVSRIYELSLMTSVNGPVAMPGTKGQWQIPDGKLWNPLTQIASMGGLLPEAIQRDSVQIWPATRNEHIVDFSDAPAGTVIYLTNILEMLDGRKPSFHDPEDHVNLSNYKVPMVMIIVDGPPPAGEEGPTTLPTTLRPMPYLPTQDVLNTLPRADYLIARSGNLGTLNQWQINNLPFDPLVPLHTVTRNQPEVWTVINGGGGWVHPIHFHQEEHFVLNRTLSTNAHPDDIGKSDIVNLDENETVSIYRNFRTFTGRYVGHCHNLLHEDHSMMFGFTILDVLPAAPTDLEAELQIGPQVNLTWTDRSDNETGFVIQRIDSGIVVDIAHPTAETESFTDSTVQPGHTYTYLVKAVNDLGPSAYTNSVTVHVTPPAAPTNLQAALQPGPRVKLTWTDESDNETGFVIERLDGDTLFVTEIPDPNAESFTDITAQPGHTYTYQVKAVNVSGPSTFTNSVVVTLPFLPAAPTSLQAILQPGPLVKLTWTDESDNETGFVIERLDGDTLFVTEIPDPNAESFTDNTAQPGHTYTYQVKAVNEAGASGLTNSAIVTLPQTPAIPTNLQATLQPGPRVHLTWTDQADNETGFVIERFDGASTVVIEVPGSNIDSYTDHSVQPGLTYTYKVKALSSLDVSGFTAPVDVAVPPVPADPTNLQATLTLNQGIRITFGDDSISESAFQLERSVNGGAFVVYTVLPPRPSTGIVSIYMDRNVSGNNTYAYRVRALNDFVPSSGYSNTASVIMPRIPRPPFAFLGRARLAPNLAFAQIALSWRDVANNTGYVIQSSTKPNFTNSSTYSVGANATSLTISRLARNTTYYIRIRSTSHYGASAWIIIKIKTPALSIASVLQLMSRGRTR